MKETTPEKYPYTNENSGGNLAFANCCHFLAKIADFGLKYCILKKNAKNNSGLRGLMRTS